VYTFVIAVMTDATKVAMKVEVTTSSAENTTYSPRLSKAVKKANQIVQGHYDEVNVLVTGLGVRQMQLFTHLHC